jgi:hypothetical protein
LVVPPYGVGEILTAEIAILRSEATKNPVPGKRVTDKERAPFDFAQGRLFDFRVTIGNVTLSSTQLRENYLLF